MSKNVLNKGAMQLNKVADLSSCTREELESRIIKLEAHQFQLQNLLRKALQNSTNEKTPGKNTDRPCNFSKHPKRHILLKLSYLGWDRQGFAAQENTLQTIEHALFSALTLTKLIESRESSNYNRCGRTDKGVSAFKQTISITVRCQLKSGLGVISDVETDYLDGSSLAEDLQNELDFPKMLNRVLPDDLRVLAWAPVEENFSARFNCIGRTYRYFFPKGMLNLEAMREACTHLLGSHDFRNLCTMDVGNGVVNYVRRVDHVSLTPVNRHSTSADQTEMFVVEIKAKSFLWHQIRAIMSILFLVGQGKEQPSIVEQLLDIDMVERKPQYHLAYEVPLILFDSSYEGISWQFQSETIADVYRHFLSLWTKHSVKTAMLQSMLTDLTSSVSPDDLDTAHETMRFSGTKSRVYTPLLKRQTCGSLGEKVENFVKRKRLNPSVLEALKDEAGTAIK